MHTVQAARQSSSVRLVHAKVVPQHVVSTSHAMSDCDSVKSRTTVSLVAAFFNAAYPWESFGRALIC